VQQYVSQVRAALSDTTPRLQAIMEKPGAQELLADVQWGLLQRVAARGIKLIAGLQDNGDSSSSGTGVDGSRTATPALRV
jgi:hypothetical protein